MGFLQEARVGEGFEPFVRLRQEFGFVPALFRAQTLLPRLIEAECGILAAVLSRAGALTRDRKERILLSQSSVNGNLYCVTVHARTLQLMGMDEERIAAIVRDHAGAGLDPADTALMDFAARLGCEPTWVEARDIDALRGHGFSDAEILDTVLVTALAQLLCTLSGGLDVEPDFEPALQPAGLRPRFTHPAAGEKEGDGAGRAPGGWLRAAPAAGETSRPLGFFKERFGFVPNLFRAQAARPEALEAEAAAFEAVLLGAGALQRELKELLLLAVSAANRNTYCVTVHSEIARGLGVPDETLDRIAAGAPGADLPPADAALLDFAVALSRQPSRSTPAQIETLRRHGFGDPQILEAIAMTALTCFLNTLQMGLGTAPDFPARRVFGRAPVPAGPEERPGAGAVEDPDADLVRRVHAGDLSGFEELVRRHHRRVYRTILGIATNVQDAEDCTQNAFIRALDHIGEFRGASKFSTWLTRIAINEALQRVRRQRGTESLDDPPGEDDPEFRPRHLLAWDDPETLYTRAELKRLVEEALKELPDTYRLVVMLRDIEELSTQETAEALGLEIGTAKTRLHRGRMMLREALAPHFAKRSREKLGA